MIEGCRDYVGGQRCDGRSGGAQGIILTRLYWVGPATVATSVLGVTAVQLIAVAVLAPLPLFSERVLTSADPQVVTAVLVSTAVLVFVVCLHLAGDPVRTYRRIALGALLISFVPNVAAGLLLRPAVDWPSMAALMLMHVTAWAVTVPMLTRLTLVRGDVTYRPPSG
jgi:hypothetical protein